MRHHLLSLTLLFSLFISLNPAALAQDIVQPQTSDGESSRTFGPDTIHYSVLNTRFLSAQVARAYGITRGDNKFLLNIAVRHQGAEGERAIKAKVSGTSSDLIYQTSLTFREVIEQDAIYYLAEFEVDNEERLSFRLQVQTATRPQPYDLQFNKTLYPDKDGI